MSQPRDDRQADLFRPPLEEIINFRHPLLIHLLVQRKGYFYHVYPVGVGLACWGAWALAKLSTWRVLVCLILTASGVGCPSQCLGLKIQSCAPLQQCRLPLS